MAASDFESVFATGRFDVADIAGSRMYGGIGNDVLLGSDRWDRMQGGPGEDTLLGFRGRDWIRGGGDRDHISGDQGIDDLHGGNGNDQILLEHADTVRGGAGHDECLQLFNYADAQTISCEIVEEADLGLRNEFRAFRGES